jgi:hypothetical protein
VFFKVKRRKEQFKWKVIAKNREKSNGKFCRVSVAGVWRFILIY